MKVFRIDEQYFFNKGGVEGKITIETINKGNIIAQQVTDIQYNGNEVEEVELQKHFNNNFDLILKAEKI